MRQNAIVLSHYSQHALLGLSLSGRVSNSLPRVACRCFARPGTNLASKQMKMDSEATADTKYYESELTSLSSICMHSHGKKKKKFHFLLIAALPDTRVVGSAIGCCILGKVMRHYRCARPRRNTQTRPHASTPENPLPES